MQSDAPIGEQLEHCQSAEDDLHREHDPGREQEAAGADAEGRTHPHQPRQHQEAEGHDARQDTVAPL